MEFQSKSSIDLEISLQKPFTNISLSAFHRNCSICNNCSELLFFISPPIKSKSLTTNSKETSLTTSPMSLVYTFRVRVMMGSSFNHVIVHNSYTRNASNGTSQNNKRSSVNCVLVSIRLSRLQNIQQSNSISK